MRTYVRHTLVSAVGVQEGGEATGGAASDDELGGVVHTVCHGKVQHAVEVLDAAEVDGGVGGHACGGVLGDGPGLLL